MARRRRLSFWRWNGVTLIGCCSIPESQRVKGDGLGQSAPPGPHCGCLCWGWVCCCRSCWGELHFFADVLRVFDELAIAVFTPIILFPEMNIAVSFDVRQSELWAAKLVH